MECDQESASVTTQFFPKSNSVHYYALTMGTLRKIHGLEAFLSLYNYYEGVQESIVILNGTIFRVQTMDFGNIKFYCLIITPIES